MEQGMVTLTQHYHWVHDKSTQQRFSVSGSLSCRGWRPSGPGPSVLDAAGARRVISKGLVEAHGAASGPRAAAPGRTRGSRSPGRWPSRAATPSWRALAKPGRTATGLAPAATRVLGVVVQEAQASATGESLAR